MASQPAIRRKAEISAVRISRLAVEIFSVVSLSRPADERAFPGQTTAETIFKVAAHDAVVGRLGPTVHGYEKKSKKIGIFELNKRFLT